MIAPAAQTVLSACVGGVLAMPASVCHCEYNSLRWSLICCVYVRGTPPARARTLLASGVATTPVARAHRAVVVMVAKSIACVHERYACPVDGSRVRNADK